MDNVNLCSNKLPRDKQYALAYFPDIPWGDRDTEVDHKWVVVKFVKGISKEEREALPNTNYRKAVYSFGDEHSNNLVAYAWDTFGASSFFGQEALCWCELPNLTKILGDVE